MSFTPIPDFDFMARLAKEDPAAFESMREKLLADAVAAAPAHLRPSLNQTVRSLNALREGKTPLEAAQAANAEMASSLHQLGTAMNDLQEASTELYVSAKLRDIAAKQ